MEKKTKENKKVTTVTKVKDRETIKMEFFQSELSLNKFLATKDIKPNKHVRRVTKGWKEEKEKEDDIDNVVELMKRGKNRGIIDLMITLNNWQDNKLRVSERIDILKFIKLELGETGEIVETKDNSFKIVLN